ncbi:MAG: sigma-54-dependent Fis family transcriptional regulator [Verrucomicrobia bacterium]|nr:sigma-54-dependent Fis family transcriptional regulator [Kiritimatiellia bacterium]MCP5487405.1 sigma-54-dependent Fis family transcriptional regulator [Verrucomicrobiota bacterium]
MKRILVVDDDRGSRESLRLIFEREYELELASQADEALHRLAVNPIDLILMDVAMPKKDGVTLLKEVAELYPNTPVIMISASANVRPVVESIKSGAYDFVIKPFEVEDLRRLVTRALKHSTLQRCVRAMKTDLSRQFPVNGLIGQSAAFHEVLEKSRRAAMSDATVMITGESGTGKEMVARQIHNWSTRQEEPFVAVHCGALPETLMESELFGHEKGAFTSADRQKPGRFDLAGSGTLFFDEVGEMSLATQVKLLRVLQEKEYMRVGGTSMIRTNARILGATNRDLAAEMREGRFREDLYYRLNVVPIHIPALRERPEDIPLLADFFLTFFRESMGAISREFAPGAMDALSEYAWPGNIRELRNVIERTLVLHGHHRVINRQALPHEFQTPATGTPLEPRTEKTNLAEAVDHFERELVLDALKKSQGVQTKAAQLLGTTRRILKYKMDKLGISPTYPDGVARDL